MSSFISIQGSATLSDDTYNKKIIPTEFLNQNIPDCSENKTFENQTSEEKKITITKILQEANSNITNARKLIQNSSFLCKKTANGGTGHTLICSLSRQVFQKAGIEESFLPEFARIPEQNCNEKSLLFILKLLNKETANNEQFCSRFYTAMGMKAPELLFISDLNFPGTNKKTSTTALQFFEKAAGTVTSENSELVFMYAFEATDLDSLLKQSTLFDLTKDSFKKMIEDIGEVAIFDLLISNGDRFFHYEEDASDLQKAFCNDGNIMFQIMSKKGKRELKQTYIIDNSASSKLWPTQISKDDNDDDFDFSMFDSESPTEEETLSCTSQPDSLENLEGQHNQSPIDFSPYLEIFKYYTDEENLEKFAEIITNGLLSKIQPSSAKEDVVESFFTDENFIKQHLINGLKKSIERLKNLNYEELINLENEEINNKKNCKTIFDLIKSGLSYIQNRG